MSRYKLTFNAQNGETLEVFCDYLDLNIKCDRDVLSTVSNDFTLKYTRDSQSDYEFFSKVCNELSYGTFKDIIIKDYETHKTYYLVGTRGVIPRAEFTTGTDIRYILNGRCDVIKEEEEAAMIKKMISVKFPDNRGRYPGKEYVYELRDELSLPTKSSHIRIIKFDDGSRPAYDIKNLLVTDTKVFQDSSKDVLDKQIGIYYGIPSWRVIREYETVSEVKTNIQELGDLVSAGAQVIHEEVSDWKETEKKLLSDIDILKPLGVTISADLNSKAGKLIADTVQADKIRTNTIVLTDGNGNEYSWDVDGITIMPYESINNKEKSIVEDKRMSKNMFDGIMKNFKFGKVDTDKIAFSMNGMAFKNSTGDYVVYNEDGTATNVSTLAFQMPLFAMPTPLAQINAGDVIVHNAREFVVVKEVTKTAIIAITPDRNELITIVPEKSIFGFDFYTKIVSPMSMMANGATSDNPFGNMLPFMLLGDGDMDKDTMMMALMMDGQNQNMMLPMLMMAGKDGSDMTTAMLMAMMMNGQNPFVQGNTAAQE